MPTQPATPAGASTRDRSSFWWGAATAAYQVEGAATTAGRGPSIWDTFSHTPGRTLDGDTGDVAVDHYRRMEADVGLMRELGLTTYRFSVAWPRVIPDGDGRVEPRGLDFYRRLVAQLRDADIEPVVTLYHWDLPQALQDRGGWAARSTVDAFVRYATIVHDALGSDVDVWTTLNEPWCSAFLGYASGDHAPGITDPRASLRAAHHLLLAHGEATREMRLVAGDEHDIGLVLNLIPVVADDDTPADRAAAERLDAMQNRLFLDATLRAEYPEHVWRVMERFRADDVVQRGDLERIAAPIDLLGVNYYRQQHVAAGSGEPTLGSPFPGCDDVALLPDPEPRTAMGWGEEPEGLEALLLRLHREYPGVPVVICENGAAYADVPDADGNVDDPRRITYLDEHVAAVERARDAGVDVRGYLVWSLLDNFEWALGYRKRFGLVYVDPTTLERTIKSSGHFYRRLIEQRRAAASGPAGVAARSGTTADVR